MNWVSVTPAQRYERLNIDLPPGHTSGDPVPADWHSWADHQRACTGEGVCAVCLGPLTGPGPLPGYSVAAGNCYSPACPAAPCRWAITPAYPSGSPGALMYAPLDREGIWQPRGT